MPSLHDEIMLNHLCYCKSCNSKLQTPFQKNHLRYSKVLKLKSKNKGEKMKQKTYIETFTGPFEGAPSVESPGDASDVDSCSPVDGSSTT